MITNNNKILVFPDSFSYPVIISIIKIVTAKILLYKIKKLVEHIIEGLAILQNKYHEVTYLFLVSNSVFSLF
jgi:hypothetical protein